MITCLYDNALPALTCTRAELPKDRAPTITELLCLAVYGAPLQSGSGKHSLKHALQPLQFEGRALWRDENGPGWLVPHLELIAAGRSWPFSLDTASESEQITLRWFVAAERWLRQWRFRTEIEGLAPDLVEKVRHLAAMSEVDAIKFALREAVLSGDNESGANKRASTFYHVLSELTASGDLKLEAIAVDRSTGEWCSPAGSPPHAAIDARYVHWRLCHDPYENELDVDRFSSENEMLDTLFSRAGRKNESSFVRWQDVRASHYDARRLLRAFLQDRIRTGAISSDVANTNAIDWGIGPLIIEPDEHYRPSVAVQSPPDWQKRIWSPLHLALIWMIEPELISVPEIACSKSMSQAIGRVAIGKLDGAKWIPPLLMKASLSAERFETAWEQLRALAADDKVRLCGTLEVRTAEKSERYQPDEILPAEIEELRLWHDGANDRVVDCLRAPEPDDTFPASAGRMWFAVMVRIASLRSCLVPSHSSSGVEGARSRSSDFKSQIAVDVGVLKSGPQKLENSILEAFKVVFPKGVPAGTQVQDVRRQICAHMGREISNSTFDRAGINKALLARQAKGEGT